VAAVEVNGELPGEGRQLVMEADLGPLSRLAANGRAGEAAAVGPEPGLRAGQNLGLGLADRDPDLGVGQLRRDRQRRPERNRGPSLGRLTGKRQQTAARPPQRQQDGERTAAEGAEESSAPEAGRG
jgi:hypothetical protein